MKITVKTTDIQKGDFIVGYRMTVARVNAWEFGKAGEVQIHFTDGSNIVTQKSWKMTVLRETATDAKYVDYRLVPNSTDEAAVLGALQAVSPKFKMDGVAVAATFELTEDPREAVLAVSKRFNVSVMRLEWGHRDAREITLDDIYRTPEIMDEEIARCERFIAQCDCAPQRFEWEQALKNLRALKAEKFSE